MPRSRLRPHRRRTAVLLAAGLLVGTTGCRSDGAGGSTVDPARAGSSIEELLRLVPLTDANAAHVLVSLYDVAADAVHLDRLDASADARAELDRLVELTMGTEHPVMVNLPELVGGQRANQQIGRLGFQPSDLIAEVEAGRPPSMTTIGIGTFDEDEVLDRAAEVTGARRSDVEGTEVVAWLDDLEIDPTLDPPLGRVPGQAGRVALPADDVLVHTTEDATMAGTIGTVGGDGPSLADDEGLRLVAEHLDEAGAYAAFLSSEAVTAASAPGGTETPSSGEDAPEPLLAYEAFGVAGAVRDDRPELVVVLVHEDDEEATANAARLERVVADGVDPQSRRPWADLLADADLTTDGPVVVARFVTERPMWASLFAAGSPLLATG